MQPKTQKLHSLDSLRKLLRARNISRTYPTIWRWATIGIPNSSGKRIKLKTIMVGRVRHASEEALDEFFRLTSR